MLMLLGEPKGTWQESWKAMEEMQKKGKIRSLGVSNFYIQDLEELVKQYQQSRTGLTRFIRTGKFESFVKNITSGTLGIQLSVRFC